MKIGVLALQGDFREHIAVLAGLDVEAVEVRTPDELARVDGLVIPGGESTTIGRLASIYGMIEPLRGRIAAGMPVLGTCAGMIFLGTGTTGRPQPQLEVLDVIVERNAFGRQVDSFEAELDVEGWTEPIHSVFIRAPWIHKVGAAVEVLATVPDATTGEGRPVLVRQDNVVACSFHPELIGDVRLHRMLIDMVETRDEGVL